MRHIAAFTLGSFLALLPAANTGAQPMSMSTTFLAGAPEPQNVVPPSASPGSATAVFLLDGALKRAALSYRMTYATLASPNVRSIVLRNFGAGKEGDVVHRVCGERAQACPTGNDGTVSGRWTSEDQALPLTAPLITELANMRVYVEIVTAAGKELRAQIEPNRFMVMPREAGVELRPADQAQRTSGTAAVRIIQFTPTHFQVAVRLTVAGASSDPTSVTLSDRSNRFEPLRLQRSDGSKQGRTLSVVVDSATSRMLSSRSFQQLLDADAVTLTVFLGTDERAALRGDAALSR